LEARFQGEGVAPLPIYWYHSKGNWMLYNFAADNFYIMKRCSRLFVLHCRSRPKYDNNSRQFGPHFEEVRGGVEPWWMARWKARTEFLLSVIWLLFLSLTVEALLRLRRYNAKRVKTRSLQEWVGHFEPKFQGEEVVPGEYFFGFYKTRHILLSNGANCTVLFLHRATCRRFDTIPACDGRTDGRTDGQTELL